MDAEHEMDCDTSSPDARVPDPGSTQIFKVFASATLQTLNVIADNVGSLKTSIDMSSPFSNPRRASTSRTTRHHRGEEDFSDPETPTANRRTLPSSGTLVVSLK
jgi:hypothetical protein